MTILNNNLRLVHISLNKLKQVVILAAANQFGPNDFIWKLSQENNNSSLFLEMWNQGR